MFNILDTISNIYEELKNSVNRAFNIEPEQPKRKSSPKPKPASRSSSKKRKEEDEFTGHSIDSVTRREDEKLKNAPSQNNNENLSRR